MGCAFMHNKADRLLERGKEGRARTFILPTSGKREG